MHVPISARQVVRFLARLRRAVALGRVEIREYALEGIRELGWSAEDAAVQLRELGVDDFLRVEESTSVTGDLIWVFTPETLDGTLLWIRLVERSGVVVISFHRG